MDLGQPTIRIERKIFLNNDLELSNLYDPTRLIPSQLHWIGGTPFATVDGEAKCEKPGRSLMSALADNRSSKFPQRFNA
jgi:hypothetical protein